MVLQVVTARQYDPIFIIPIIFNIHINLLQKFTECVIPLKNKIPEPVSTRICCTIINQGFGDRRVGDLPELLVFLKDYLSNPRLQNFEPPIYVSLKRFAPQGCEPREIQSNLLQSCCHCPRSNDSCKDCYIKMLNQ